MMNAKKIVTLCLILLGVFVYWFASHFVEFFYDVFGRPLQSVYGLTLADWVGVFVGVLTFILLGRYARLTEYLNAAFSELFKVVHPTPQESYKMAGVVVVMLFVVAVVLALLDVVWTSLTRFIFT